MLLHHSYAVLLSASPDLKNADPEDKFALWFSKSLIKLMRTKNLVESLPKLIKDASSFYERLPASSGTGQFDPFVEMNRIIYQLTMRTVGCTEIADSQELLSRSWNLVNQVGENSSRARIIIPWLPTWKYMKRSIAAGRFYMLVNKLTQERKATGRREHDAMQLLVDEGESGLKIVEVNVPVDDPGATHD